MRKVGVAMASILDTPFELEVPCIQVNQPIGTFFIASIDSKSLCEITFADVRRMSGDREIETYLGIQRPLSKSRVEEIQQYVTTVDACFPTAVILAIDGKCATYDSDHRTLTLKSYFDSDDREHSIPRLEIAKVLDGQHRIEGLRNYQGDPFEVNVSIFVDMDVENQAYVFSTVNLAQTKVNKSLVYDLFDYARARSPQKTCHNIAVALDSLEGGPFYKRIKRLGSATDGRFTETLTQAAFVEGLLPYLTNNKAADRDIYMRGRVPARASSDELNKFIFRNMFIDDKDLEIADVVLNYFDAVRERWPLAWERGGGGWMLNKTNGFKALMRLLRAAYLDRVRPGEIPSRDDFLSLFKRSSLTDDDFTVEQFKPGTSGETALYNNLRDEMRFGRI